MGKRKKDKEGDFVEQPIEKYNIRDTKQYYSEINDKVLKGIEVITYNASKKLSEVSHIKTELLDTIFDKFVCFHPRVELDEELNVWTVAADEIDMYGEGSTKEEAIEDLLDAIVHFCKIYAEKIELYAVLDSAEKKAYMRKMLRCENDREKIRKVIGL